MGYEKKKIFWPNIKLPTKENDKFEMYIEKYMTEREWPGMWKHRFCHWCLGSLFLHLFEGRELGWESCFWPLSLCLRSELGSRRRTWLYWFSLLLGLNGGIGTLSSRACELPRSLWQMLPLSTQLCGTVYQNQIGVKEVA